MAILRIPLRDGQFFAIIDESDGPAVLAKRWHLNVEPNSLYVRSCISGGRNISLQAFLMNPPPGFVVDHINGDGLDNRRVNLRIATRSQNNRNRRKAYGKSSRFKGVSWASRPRRWVAQIKVGNRVIYLGSFKDEEPAAIAYNAAAIEHFGEFAIINIIPTEDSNAVP